MATCRFSNSGAINRSVDRSLDHGFVHVVAPRGSSFGFRESAGCGENVLPAPLAVGVWIFTGEGMRQLNLPRPVLKISFVDVANALDVLMEGWRYLCWQHRNTVLSAFAVADHDFEPFEIDVLDSEL